MYTQEDFEADVIRDFEFLVTQYGMRREPLRSAGVGTWITYANPMAKVIIEYEVGGFCGVTVQNPRFIQHDPQERSEFDLEEIIEVSPNKPQRRRDPKNVTELIARSAETLRTLGDAVLKGDFDALHERQRKVVEAGKRTNPVGPN